MDPSAFARDGRSGPSRRMRVGLCAGVIAICASVALVSQSASPEAARPAAGPVSVAAYTAKPTPIIWGINSSLWDRFRSHVPAAGIVRVYFDRYISYASQVPASWPRYHNATSGRQPCTVLSFRPLPGPLFSHRLDKTIRHFDMTAPHNGCAFEIPWHENGPGNVRHYPASIHQPYNFKREQKYLMHLARGTPVKVGVIAEGPTNQMKNWIARGLGVASNDIYDFGDGRTPDKTLTRHWLCHRIHQDTLAFSEATGERYPDFIISETNSGLNSHRYVWFSNMSYCMKRYDVGAKFKAVITFWRAGHTAKQHKLSGAWPPWPSVIALLRQLANEDRSAYPRPRPL